MPETDLVELNVWIRLAQEIISRFPPGSDEWTDSHRIAGSFLERRHNQSGTQSDIEAAISHTQVAIEHEDPVPPERFANLGAMFLKLYYKTKKPADIEGAISNLEISLSSTPEHEPARVLMLCNLGDALSHRFRCTEKLRDLDLSITIYRQAEALMPEDDPERPVLLHSLGRRLLARYPVTKEFDDLKAAIAVTESGLCCAKTSEERGSLLESLSLMLFGQCERTGSVRDIDAVISSTNLALSLETIKDNDRRNIRKTLTYALLKRYEYLGHTQDIEMALAHANDDVATYRHDEPGRWQAIFWLATAISARYTRTRDIDDLEAAISKAELASSMIPDDDTSLSSVLGSLGDLYLLRFNRTGKLEDLDFGILKVKSAMPTSLDNEPSDLTVLGWLGRLLYERYNYNKSLIDLREAIHHMELALPSTTEEHPPAYPNLGRVSTYYHLGRAQLSLAQHTEQPSDLEAALKTFITASMYPGGIPLHRVQSAHCAMRMLHVLKMWKGASELAWRIVRLLPLVCGRNLSRADQQHAVLRLSGFTADACSVSLLAGDIDHALQHIEYGRGLILRYLIDGRDDLSSLQQDHPDLAEELQNLRSEASGPINLTPGLASTGTLRGRGDVARQFDECLDQIRKLAGYERFLMEPSLEELKECAVEGPIVVVNVTHISSDAILVTTSGIRSINLPEMSFQKTKFLHKSFNQYRSTMENLTSCGIVRDMAGETEEAHELDEEFLSWLWSSCVEPILEELPSSSFQTSRVWWIGSGIASSLPFHAAGNHFAGSTDNTLSRTIPSYTSTIKSLAYARSCAARSMGSQPEKTSVLMVAMPETPGQPTLSGIVKECSIVQKSLSDKFTLTSLVKPSVEQVMAHLTGSDIVHFACHGLSDQADPSDSHILLQKDTPEGLVVDKLTVQELSQMQSIGRARIAYLSACSTAEVKATALASEALHLASAFQVAGFGHVIGSLWFADDETCVEMSRLFYAYLCTNMYDRMSDRLIAEAYRHAVLVTRSGRTPNLWASFIHFGA